MQNLIIAKSTAGVWSFQKSSNGTLADGTKYTGTKITVGSEKDQLIINNDGSKMYFGYANVYYKDTNYSTLEELLDELATDGLAVNFNKGEGSPQLTVYSETETVVGTWIDGKPIYNKVVVLPAGSLFVNTSNQVVNIPNLKRLLPTSNYSLYINQGSDEVLINPFYTSASGSTPATFTNTDYIDLYQLGSDIKLRVSGLSTIAGSYESTFILFYTKTTD